MSFLFNLFRNHDDEKKEKEFSEDDYVKVEGDKIKKLNYISANDIKNVSLKPSKKRSIKNNNRKELLDCILEVKLKSTPKNDKNNTFEPRHPCLKELLNKIPKKN